MLKPYLLLDAGGTIVFPNQDKLIELASKNGVILTREQLYQGYYRLIHQLDTRDIFPSNPWPKGYAQAILNILNISEPNTEEIVWAVNTYHEKEKNLWTFTFPWVYKTLSRLVEKGYRMSILSNSDGRAKQIFDELKLSPYFEHIFDSQELNCEKPNRMIFDKVRNELNIHADEMLYVGDIYKVDILGANRAGIGGIHIDPMRLYRSFPGVHLDNIASLESWLSEHLDYPTKFVSQLFPFPNKGYKESLLREYQIYSKNALSELTQN